MIATDNRSAADLALEGYRVLAEFVLAREGAPEDAELALSFVTAEEMQRLNRDYRGIDAPTDVLAFENDDGLLGDVVVCPDIAREHAKEFDSDFESEMELMITHGVLHLRGYDHLEDAEAELMEARENELLQAWRAL